MGRDEKRAPLKTPAWEATLLRARDVFPPESRRRRGETAVFQATFAVADLGEGPGGENGPPTYLRVWTTAPLPPPSLLRVWIRHCFVMSFA